MSLIYQPRIALCLCLMVCVGVAISSDNEKRCINARYQKTKPGPENLNGTVCSAWSGNSCCNATVAASITNLSNNDSLTWLNFRWDHCDKPLSAKCRSFFVQDLCFYECSPNMGPWIITDPKRRKSRVERFLDVPLCQTQCDQWYDACKNDLTCTDNWSEFEWIDGINKCPGASTCRLFSEVFGDPKTFCEKVFAGSFRYVYDDQPCFKFDPSQTEADLNDRVENWQRGLPKSGASAPMHFFLLLAGAQLFSTRIVIPM
ncbi:folate receptor beta-like [Paramacrobiotus metropolitanus]|uniref:folate receptor beta-like n=1 Tax=Paramacrobiotus metropolitanus TaxID=2943436 RepID=UPI002446073E|nr:folate receptor beta-like [Paramacrobiotus metropolitanus]